MDFEECDREIKETENAADLGTKALSKSSSVGMIAKIVAVLMSEGFSIEAAKVGFKSSTPWMSGFFLLVLVCMVMVAFVSMKCLSTAVEELGKEGKEHQKKTCFRTKNSNTYLPDALLKIARDLSCI